MDSVQRRPVLRGCEVEGCVVVEGLGEVPLASQCRCHVFKVFVLFRETDKQAHAPPETAPARLSNYFYRVRVVVVS